MDGRCLHNARTMLAVVLLPAAMAATPCHAQRARCQELAKLVIPQAEITGAADVNSGSFTPPQDPERERGEGPSDC